MPPLNTLQATDVTGLIAAVAGAHAKISPPPGAVLEASIEAGENLLALKDRLPHGAWEETLRQIGIPPRSGRLYMALARNRGAITAAGCESIRQAQAVLAERRIDKGTGLPYISVPDQQS
jgi:hypothetical protein